MNRIVTGVQCTNKPHLGNILGAMLPTIALIKDPSYTDAFIFLADYHTLTLIKDPAERKKYTYINAAAWLSMGLDPEKSIFYRQSKVPAVCELLWYFSCFTPYPMLANAHAFKDKTSRIATVNAGLFTYPVLMAADILLYDGVAVPVGKDQIQHLEITRDIAQHFNNQYGLTFFSLPKALVDPSVAIVPGTDGQKMSKSYHNTIDIFLPESALRKSIMSIKTDSKLVHEPKDPHSCIVFKLYSLLASGADIAYMREQYLQGGYGYGQAKEALYQVILDKFAVNRKKFQSYLLDLWALEAILKKGEERAQVVSNQKLIAIRTLLGYD